MEKHYIREFKTARGVVNYLQRLDVGEYDISYIQSLKKGGELDMDMWLEYDEYDNPVWGASVQVEYTNREVFEYDDLGLKVERPFWSSERKFENLCEMGIVPSFDGKIWRLHSGENADVIWEGAI